MLFEARRILGNFDEIFVGALKPSFGFRHHGASMRKDRHLCALPPAPLPGATRVRVESWKEKGNIETPFLDTIL